MIANCPSCGTHYKHDPPRDSDRVRARCGRCDTTLDLSRLRPYRIVPAAPPTHEPTLRVATRLPIGLDHPNLATTMARNVTRNVAEEVPPRQPPPTPVSGPDAWEYEDPLPPIPEMHVTGISDSADLPTSEDALLRPVSLDRLDRVDREIPEAPTAGGVSPASGGAATFFLWLASGAIAGTGVSWTMGGTTMTGLAAGAGFGALAGWGWLRWTSPK